MAIELYQYGHATGLDGLSIGVARQVPRGIRKTDYLIRGYFHVWFPLLAPSRELFMAYRHGEIPFKNFARDYRAEMRSPGAVQAIRLLAAMGRVQRINLGCFCEDESRCHRSVLKKLIDAAAAGLPVAAKTGGMTRCASPPCFMPEIEY